MHEELAFAVEDARRRAERARESFCVVSGMKKGRLIYRIYPMKGFGLPPGGRLEEVIEPSVERVQLEPPEKISSNGF